LKVKFSQRYHIDLHMWMCRIEFLTTLRIMSVILCYLQGVSKKSYYFEHWYKLNYLSNFLEQDIRRKTKHGCLWFMNLFMKLFIFFNMTAFRGNNQITSFFKIFKVFFKAVFKVFLLIFLISLSIFVFKSSSVFGSGLYTRPFK